MYNKGPVDSTRPIGKRNNFEIDDLLPRLEEMKSWFPMVWVLGTATILYLGDYWTVAKNLVPLPPMKNPTKNARRKRHTAVLSGSLSEYVL